jgi:hypothetical protein
LNLNNFKITKAMGLKINSVPNFMKIYQAVQALLMGDSQTGW